MYLDEEAQDDDDGFVKDLSHTEVLCATTAQVNNIQTLNDESKPPIMKQNALIELLTGQLRDPFCKQIRSRLNGRKDCRFRLMKMEFQFET